MKSKGAEPFVKQSSVASKDGTIIGFKSMGDGPGVIIVPGLLSSSNEFIRFAEELKETFTVHIMDRRGRGISGVQGNDYSIRKESEDLTAVREATGASYLFGHSYGGLIALETARASSLFTKIAVYEPGVSINESIPISWLPPYEKAMIDNDALKAFAVFVKATAPVKSARYAPLWYLKFFLRLMRKHWEKMEGQLWENLNEYREIGRLDSSYENYGTINASTLLIAGEKSAVAVNTVNALGGTLADAKVHIIPKLGHFAPMNDHSPAAVAQHVKLHFIS